MQVLMRQGLQGRVPKRAGGEKRNGGESRNPEKPGFCDAIAKSRPELSDCMFGENEVYNIRWL